MLVARTLSTSTFNTTVNINTFATDKETNAWTNANADANTMPLAELREKDQ
jgi:hypothetical protein